MEDIHTILSDSRKQFGSKEFIVSVDQDRSITFKEIDEYTAKVANFLKDRKASKESIICLIGKNSLETLIIFLGVLRYGAILCPINFEESKENISRITSRLKPLLCFYDDDMDPECLNGAPLLIRYSDLNSKEPNSFFRILKRYKQFFEQPLGESGDIAEILFTSGTTETPKGVAISREGLLLMTDEVIGKLDLDSDFRMLEYRAYNWASTQLLSIISTLRVGATLILARKFSRSRFPIWLKQHRVTVSSGVPTVINILVTDPVRLRKDEVPDLRYITSSSAPLSAESHKEFEKIYDIPINQMAGMTEAGWMLGNPPAKRKVGSVGLPFKYKKVFVRAENGEPCEPGKIGELIISGRSMGMGYLNDEGGVDAFPVEGFPTGDLGYMDDEGYVFITGRKKELIIRGGVNISPNEITDRILALPSVTDAVTFGIPDKIYGEEIACLIVPEKGCEITSKAVANHCRATLPEFKMPKIIHFIDKIPLNNRGKIEKKQLVELLFSKE